MKRTVLNLLALAVITTGSVHLLPAQQTVPIKQTNCCESGDGDKCCGGTGCKADASSCEAW